MEIEYEKDYLRELYEDGKYRLEFRTRMKDGEPRITICELTDLTNHYKK